MKLLSIHFLPLDKLLLFNPRLQGHYERVRGLYDDRGIAIVVFTDFPIWRQLFTLFHELIHFFIDISSQNRRKKWWRHHKFDCLWQKTRQLLDGSYYRLKPRWKEAKQ